MTVEQKFYTLSILVRCIVDGRKDSINIDEFNKLLDDTVKEVFNSNDL